VWVRDQIDTYWWPLGGNIVLRARKQADGLTSTDFGPIYFEPEAASPDEGWTVAELKQFAADHEPPIAIPSGAKKSEILDAILLAIAHHDDEEDD
jgi:hypothetical protein